MCYNMIKNIVRWTKWQERISTLDEELYKSIRILALQKGVNANDLIEEGMKLIIEREDKKN